jgi:peptide/nickel transport system substrate-binding protein
MSPRRNAITLLVISGLGCAAKQARTPDDTLVLVIETPMTTADPRYALTNYDGKLARLVAPGLTSVDTQNAEPRLELAAAIERIDGVTIDVQLRPDARFSDGTPVTADDVARTYQTVMDEACGSLYAKGFHERYRAVEATGERTVRFHLHRPLATFDSDVEFGVLSFAGVPPGGCRPPRVIGAGPYVLRELTSRAARLEANPHYRIRPALPRIEIKFVRDAAARILMLVGGSADLLQNAVRLDLVDDVIERPRVRVETAPSVLLTYMLLNNEDPVLRDRRVRQAIALALDRPAIVEAKFGGRAVLATGLLPPAHWAYHGEVARWEHDLQRAARLLDEAGLRPDRSGVRARLIYKTSADAFRVAVARVIASQLAKVGIDVEVRSFEFATFFADIKKGNYQIATMQSPEITEPDYYYWFFHSSRMPSPRDPDGSNRWRYRDPEVDRLVEAGREELDPARRKQLYAEVQRLIAEDVPIVPLWHEDNVVLTNVGVTGYTIVPNARFVGLVGARKTGTSDLGPRTSGN